MALKGIAWKLILHLLVIFSRVIHQRISFFFIFASPGVFFRKRRTIYHTYVHLSYGVCTSASMPGAHWFVCSGVRTVIKLSACITRLNHHPGWLSILLHARVLEQHTHTVRFTWPVARIHIHKAYSLPLHIDMKDYISKYRYFYVHAAQV